MKKRKIMAAVVIIGALSSMPVYAADSLDEKMMNLDGSESITSEINSIGTGLGGESLFDISGISSGLDMERVNLQYEQLVNDMMDSSALTDTEGLSMDCMELFNETYGDIAGSIQLKEPEIPEGFTVNNMLLQGQKAVNEAYAAATSSESFTAVKNNISIGKIFTIANQGLSMPELASGDTMSEMLSGMGLGSSEAIRGEFESSEDTLSDFKGSYTDMVVKAKENLLNMADIAENSTIFPEDGETVTDNISERMDSIRYDRRNNSFLGKIINLFGSDIPDYISESWNGIEEDTSEKINNAIEDSVLNEAIEQSEEKGLDWSHITFPR